MANCLPELPGDAAEKADGHEHRAQHQHNGDHRPRHFFHCPLGGVLADSFPWVMCRSQFSTTTMASSTTMPMARTIRTGQGIDREPQRLHAGERTDQDTGTATPGINVARQLCKKRYTTRMTSTIASPSVFTTSLMETSINRVVSWGCRTTRRWETLWTPLTIQRANPLHRFQRVRPGERNVSRNTFGLPFQRPSSVWDCAPVQHGRRPSNRTMDPLGMARTIISSKSFTSVRRPCVMTGIVSSVPFNAGSAR